MAKAKKKKEIKFSVNARGGDYYYVALSTEIRVAGDERKTFQVTEVCGDVAKTLNFEPGYRYRITARKLRKLTTKEAKNG